jgi:hypothetical protein
MLEMQNWHGKQIQYFLSHFLDFILDDIPTNTIQLYFYIVTVLYLWDYYKNINTIFVV